MIIAIYNLNIFCNIIIPIYNCNIFCNIMIAIYNCKVFYNAAFESQSTGCKSCMMAAYLIHSNMTMRVLGKVSGRVVGDAMLHENKIGNWDLVRSVTDDLILQQNKKSGIFEGSDCQHCFSLMSTFSTNQLDLRSQKCIHLLDVAGLVSYFTFPGIMHWPNRQWPVWLKADLNVEMLSWISLSRDHKHWPVVSW